MITQQDAEFKRPVIVDKGLIAALHTFFKDLQTAIEQDPAGNALSQQDADIKALTAYDRQMKAVQIGISYDGGKRYRLSSFEELISLFDESVAAPRSIDISTGLISKPQITVRMSNAYRGFLSYSIEGTKNEVTLLQERLRDIFSAYIPENEFLYFNLVRYAFGLLLGFGTLYVFVYELSKHPILTPVASWALTIAAAITFSVVYQLRSVFPRVDFQPRGQSRAKTDRKRLTYLLAALFIPVLLFAIS